MKTAKKAHEILKKRVPPDSNFTEIGWHNELTDIVNEIYEYQQYAQQQPTPPTKPAEGEKVYIECDIEEDMARPLRIDDKTIFVKPFTPKPSEVTEDNILDILAMYEKEWDNNKGEFLPLGVLQKDKIRCAAKAIKELYKNK